MLIRRKLNNFPLSVLHKVKSVKAPLVLITLALLSVGPSCGKRKPPLPPRERIAQRVEAEAFQRGSSILLSWKMPARNAGAGSLLNIARADVYRLAEPLTSPQTISEEEFASRSTLVAAIPVKDSDFGLATMTYTDVLEFAGQSARLRYAVRFVNSSGQKAAFSNFVLIEPASRVAAAPTSLTVVLSQEAATVSWLAPRLNVDGSSPVNLLGYNIYRSISKTEPAKLLNKAPITETKFEDRLFEFGKTYYYFVRAVSLGTEAQPVESSESNIETVRTADTFPPSAPASITLAATPTTISIFFAANPETDVLGYRIYRSLDPVKPKSQWELMTPKLQTANTFQDTAIESGKAYYYYVTAEDINGNVSEPSEVVSETVP